MFIRNILPIYILIKIIAFILALMYAFVFIMPISCGSDVTCFKQCVPGTTMFSQHGRRGKTTGFIPVQKNLIIALIYNTNVSIIGNS
jgi:hypothetical protein